MNKNILFVLGSLNPQQGGVARVANNLATELCSLGWRIYSLSSVIDGTGPYVESAVFPKPFESNIVNSECIVELHSKYNFGFVLVVNPQQQWVIEAVSILKGKTKIIGQFHNSPFGFYSCTGFIKGKRIADILFVRKICFLFNSLRYRKYYSKVNDVVDKMVLLSDSYKKELNSIFKFPSYKLIGIANPFLTAESFDIGSKSNSIVYVGRIANDQKRISSLLRIWKKVQPLIADWTLEIVGGGNELPIFENKAKEMSLGGITFHGFKSPDEYYKKAKIIVMTSLNEGFPMSLVEAMQYGCVPILFNSFGAASDIVDDGVNGVLVKPFNENRFACKLVSLIQDEHLNNMSKMCVKKTHIFDSGVIIKQWLDMFEGLAGSHEY